MQSSMAGAPSPAWVSRFGSFRAYSRPSSSADATRSPGPCCGTSAWSAASPPSCRGTPRGSSGCGFPWRPPCCSRSVVRSWLTSPSIVPSMMMIVRVFAVAVTQHMTVVGHFRALRYSPTLRFIVLGAMMYTLTSLQGSIEALRSVNTITHFTHFTVAHAHLGLYGFFAMVMFGSIYFIMPRVLGREWPSAALISLHFWLVACGFAIYFVGLSMGGWLQGLAMLDAKQPFMASVAVTLPYLEARSLGGS